MTKEEILHAQASDFEDGRLTYLQVAALNAMDTYARQEAIAFSLWMNDNSCREGVNEWTCRFTKWKEKHTMDALYLIYQQQKS